METQVYKVSGIQCGSCKIMLEKAVAKVKGIVDPIVNLATKSLSVSYDPVTFKMEELQAAVSEAGAYGLITDNSVEGKEESTQQTHSCSCC